eukprot:69738-Karenia_brevis.AAC.1
MEDEICRRVTEAGCLEYVNKLKAHAKTKGKPWSVTLRSPDDEAVIKDSELISEYYNARKQDLGQDKFKHIRWEAADLGEHVFKIPSCVTFRMCINPQTCLVCTEILHRKQQVDPAWHPSKILAPLKSNNYQMYMPTTDMKSPPTSSSSSSSAPPPLPPPLSATGATMEPPAPGTTGRPAHSKYLPFVTLQSAQYAQYRFEIPTNAKSRRQEQVYFQECCRTESSLAMPPS